MIEGGQKVKIFKMPTTQVITCIPIHKKENWHQVFLSQEKKIMTVYEVSQGSCDMTQDQLYNKNRIHLTSACSDFVQVEQCLS